MQVDLCLCSFFLGFGTGGYFIDLGLEHGTVSYFHFLTSALGRVFRWNCVLTHAGPLDSTRFLGLQVHILRGHRTTLELLGASGDYIYLCIYIYTDR